MKINPLASWIVAETNKAATTTASGIILPESATEKSKIATVQAVGKDVKTIKVGDEILYKEYSTTEVTHDKVDYILVKEEDVLATVDS